MFKENDATAGALRAVKRFYVCTNTPIPDRIVTNLAPIQLDVDACPAAS